MTWISGGSGGGSGPGSLLFSSVLSAPANAIDTLATIPTTFNLLELFAYLRTDEAVVTSAVAMTFNNDTGNNYDRQATTGNNVTMTVAPSNARANIDIQASGASHAANFFSSHSFVIPAYAGTTGFKVPICLFNTVDSAAANGEVCSWAAAWRNTAAITRVALTAPAGKNLIAGSAFFIYGR